MTRTCSTDGCSRELSRRNKSGLCRPCLARKNLCTPERQAKAVAGLKRHFADPVARQQHAERSRARLAAWRATPAGAERQREMACENLRRGNAPEYRERRVRGIRAAAYPGIPEDRWDECMQLTGISAPEQSVLMVLAIMANGEAQCWPAINGAAGLTGKTKLSERAVQNATKSLAAAGHVTRVERPGRGMIYTVHPRTSCTPADDAPVQEVRPAGGAPTPAPPAPKQPRTTNPSKASPPKSAWPCPDAVDPIHWADLLANRKSKRLTNTPTALAGIMRDLAKFADDEWPPGRIVQHAAERGWGAIFDPRPRDTRNGQRPHHDRSEPQNPMVRAVQRSEARAAGRDRPGVQPHLLT